MIPAWQASRLAWPAVIFSPVEVVAVPVSLSNVW